MSAKSDSMSDPPAARRDIDASTAAFYAACEARDPALLDAVLDEQIEWFIAGPVDQLDYYGARKGKSKVIELLTRIMPCYFHIVRIDILQKLVQDERVAINGRTHARQRETGRMMEFSFAHFLTFRHGKLVSVRGVADTLDVAEQVSGRPIHINSGVGLMPIERNAEIAPL